MGRSISSAPYMVGSSVFVHPTSGGGGRPIRPLLIGGGRKIAVSILNIRFLAKITYMFSTAIYEASLEIKIIVKSEFIWLLLNRRILYKYGYSEICLVGFTLWNTRDLKLLGRIFSSFRFYRLKEKSMLNNGNATKILQVSQHS